MPALALRLREVSHSYGGAGCVLDRVSLSVPRGSISVVMGPNGSGKTTLLRIAAGLLAPQSGEASAGEGLPVGAALRQGRIGYVPQQLGLVRSASALDNVLLGGLRRSGWRSLVGLPPAEVRASAVEALELVGLSERAEQPVSTLSGGERQRVAIARSLVQRPELLVADELVSSLDAAHSRKVIEICRALRAKGVGMLLALHHLEVALELADHLHFLDRASISGPCKPSELSAEELRSAMDAEASPRGPGPAPADEPKAGTWDPVVP